MTARLIPPARHSRLSAFARAEDGTMMIFVLSLMVIMLMLGGMAVDLMRYEQRRTLLQQTTDRSVLAAASLTQELVPEQVVDDHFEKADLEEYLEGVEVTNGMNFRTVSANARLELPTFFMHMMGIDELQVPAASMAEQRISNVEIVLVLDVSGSMQGAKIANLKTAAMEFIDTVKERDSENRISVTIVPYNAQVNIPVALRDKYDFTHQNGYNAANCVEFPASAFSTLTIPTTATYPMYAFADLTGSTTQGSGYVAWNHATEGTMSPANSFCRNTAANMVRLPNDDPAELKAQINALVADGNTSITLGMKWGVALIDPAARPMMTELMNEGEIPASHAGRPFDWVDEDSMKVIVVMTDGDHVDHVRIKDAYKTGPSPIWKSADGRYSIRHTAGRPDMANPAEYYVPHINTWQLTPWGDSDATQQSWQQVWQSQRLRWVAWQLYARALGTSSATRTSTFNTWMGNFRSTWMNEATMDSTMLQSCTQAKNNDVVVYGIAFEAPPQGTSVISQCASSAAHFYDANGLEIQQAFRSIASNISQLRLTQ